VFGIFLPADLRRWRQDTAAGTIACPPTSTQACTAGRLASRLAVFRDPLFICATNWKDAGMLGFVAAVLFIIAFLINATSTATSAVFSPTSLMLVGLACLALHLAGVGTKWSVPRRGTRR
jgi:hypothetical protein